jgi:hypothetical protein
VTLAVARTSIEVSCLAGTWHRHAGEIRPLRRRSHPGRFGQTGLEESRRLAVKDWAAELTGRYAPATVIVTLLSLVLTAAVEERMIAHNPIQACGYPTPAQWAMGHATASRAHGGEPAGTGGQALDEETEERPGR